MTQSEEAVVFDLIKKYSTMQHQCLVTEMFLSDTKTEYIFCFRPMSAHMGSSNRYACRYLRIGADDARTAGELKILPTSITDQLDKELPALGQSV